MGSHTGPYQTSLFCRRFLSDSLLVNSSDISVSGSCCLNCSQRTAPITQLRLQYFESLATFSKHWIAAIWQLLRCSTYLPRLTVSTTSCYFQARREPAGAPGQTTFRAPPHPLPFFPLSSPSLPTLSPAAKRPPQKRGSGDLSPGKT